MYVYTHVCMYGCMYVCMYVCVYMCVCIYVCTYMCMMLYGVCIKLFVFSSKSPYAKMPKAFSPAGTSVETNAEVHPFTLVS